MCEHRWQPRRTQAIICMRLRTKLPYLLKIPWTLPCSYYACVQDNLDGFKTPQCERSRIDTTIYTFEALDAPISLCVGMQGSLDIVMTTVCQYQRTKIPCSVSASKTQKTLTHSEPHTSDFRPLREPLPLNLCKSREKRRENRLIKCVQMSLSYLLFIHFPEGTLGVKADPSSYTCGQGRPIP